MKRIVLERADLASCIDQAKHGRVLVLQRGRPVALVIGVEGLDPEQLELGTSGKFWKLIEARRKQNTLTRERLEKKLSGRGNRVTRRATNQRARPLQ